MLGNLDHHCANICTRSETERLRGQLRLFRGNASGVTGLVYSIAPTPTMIGNGGKAELGPRAASRSSYLIPNITQAYNPVQPNLLPPEIRTEYMPQSEMIDALEDPLLANRFDLAGKIRNSARALAYDVHPCSRDTKGSFKFDDHPA